MADFSNPFADPVRFSDDIVLIVEDKKIHVSKQFLAINSPVFATMLFEKFKEEGREVKELEIKDVVFEEFVGLMELIHPGHMCHTPITNTSIEYILKLADQFQMKDVLDRCEAFLMKKIKFEMVKKLFLADQYKLLKLRDNCLNSIASDNNIPALQDHPEYANLSDSTKIEIGVKMMEQRSSPYSSHSQMVADDFNPFAAPTKFTDVVLIVEDKQIHVSKQYLAVHSTVFDTKFFGEFAEKGKEEVEIKNVKYEEFVDLLKVIHPGYTPITVTSVSHILKLADQFQMKDALEQCEAFLLKTGKFEMTKKLFMADQYNLPKLRDNCIKSIASITDLAALTNCPDYDNLSETTKMLLLPYFMSYLAPLPFFNSSDY